MRPPEMKIRKILVAVCAVLAAGAVLLIGWYPALYYYYLWQLNHTPHGAYIIDLGKDIEKIAPHIVPLLVHTYEDVNAPTSSRGAAAGGLIKADRNRAETLFLGFLDNKDDEIVVMAILNLGAAKSTKAFERITEFAHHPNKDIRWAVAVYLGDFRNVESISLLNEMREHDPEGQVRGEAASQLHRAETLFLSLLDSKDDEIVRMAIVNLGAAKNAEAFERIIVSAHHPNKDIRWAVTVYLGNFRDAKSILLLQEMMKNDPDEDVRRSAGNELYKPDVPSGH
jgi:HEAT repeat protein